MNDTTWILSEFDEVADGIVVTSVERNDHLPVELYAIRYERRRWPRRPLRINERLGPPFPSRVIEPNETLEARSTA